MLTGIFSNRLAVAMIASGTALAGAAVGIVRCSVQLSLLFDTVAQPHPQMRIGERSGLS